MSLKDLETTNENITAIEDLIRSEFQNRVRTDPKYSLRTYATSLGLEPSALSKIFRQKRKLSKRIAARSLSYLLGNETARETPKNSSDFQKINANLVTMLSQWFYFAILELIHVKSFKPDLEWISTTLKIDKKEVEIAVNRLIDLGFITVNEDGSWTDTFLNLTNITGPVFSKAQTNYQRQLRELSIIALSDTDSSQRDHSSMTMAIDPKRLPEAKEALKKFRQEFCANIQKDSHPEEVYQLTLSFFPISDTNKKE